MNPDSWVFSQVESQTFSGRYQTCLLAPEGADGALYSWGTDSGPQFISSQEKAFASSVAMRISVILHSTKMN